MKKLFAIAIAASMITGLYGLTIGIGAAYEDFTEEVYESYFAAKINCIIPVLPILSLRVGLADIEFHSTNIHLGTGIEPDLMIHVPMAGMIQPYIIAGVWFQQDISTTLKGGLGADFGFGGFSGYLEGYLYFISPDVGDSYMPLSAQAGVRFPLDL